MRLFAIVCSMTALLAACAGEPVKGPAYHLIPGTHAPGRQPDGNSIILDAPDGLIVIDTGRHQPQQEAILAYARERNRPIAAIVNTHWHLDHSGGNAEIRRAFPRAQIVASRAVENALTGFLARSRQGALEYIASGKADAASEAEIRGDIAAVDERVSLLPTLPVTGSGELGIAGRAIQVNLARHAATEGDVWLLDGDVAIVGDLVVTPVPFFDTACPEGWRKALGEIAAAPFTTLIPGHGAPMSRARFDVWRGAFDNLLDCAATDKPAAECAAGWRRDAAVFTAGVDPKRIDGAIAYYMESRLRSESGRSEYCAA